MSETLVEALGSALRAPYELVTAAGERTWLPMLATSLLIAALIALRARSTAPVAAFLSPRRWLHPSSRMDVKLVVLASLIRSLALAPLMLSAVGIALATVHQLTAWLGPASPSSLPTWAIVAIYSVTLFIAWDGSRYLVHRLLHRVPLLWELHKVHHSAEQLTPLTVHRVHPLESLLFALRGAIVTGLITGLFFYLYADRAVQWELFGVSGIGMLLNAAGANLRHSHVWLSYGPRLEHFLISPAQHQLHHAVDPALSDANYGSFLAIWDWLGGSLRLAGNRRELALGLAASERNHDPHSATSAIVGPLLAIGRALPVRERHEVQPNEN